MNLFIDTISPKNMLFLFDDEKNILHSYVFDVRLQESSRLIEELDGFLMTYKVSYTDIKKIGVVVGPGSFTGIRTTVLLANTLNYVVKGEMFGVSYFDLFSRYPIVKTSSKRDVFLKKTADCEIEVVTNEYLENYIKENNISQIYGEFPETL
jgi:tRNA A37 threonylcarbamoyladenosine modification protein TsaB